VLQPAVLLVEAVAKSPKKMSAPHRLPNARILIDETVPKPPNTSLDEGQRSRSPTRNSWAHREFPSRGQRVFLSFDPISSPRIV